MRRYRDEIRNLGSENTKLGEAHEGLAEWRRLVMRLRGVSLHFVWMQAEDKCELGVEEGEGV